MYIYTRVFFFLGLDLITKTESPKARIFFPTHPPTSPPMPMPMSYMRNQDLPLNYYYYYYYNTILIQPL